MPLRAAIDLGHLRLARAGTARAALALADAAQALPGVEVVRLGEGPLVERDAPGRARTVLALDLAWHPVLARRAARRAAADVLHCAIPRGPLRPGSPPAVVAVYDVLHLQAPETMSGWNRRMARLTFARVVRAAARVVATSRDAAEALERDVGVAPGRIVLAPLGVDERFRAPAPRLPAPLAGPFALFVGTLEPRKNLPRLAAACARLELPLVVAGAGGWGPDAVPAGDVRFLGRVDDDALHALYAQAAVVCVPSLHEGFGLTAAEALATGAPVVAAARGALPDVCGEAAVLVDPLDVLGIAGGIEEALRRAPKLRAAGPLQVAPLTWARHAELVAGAWRAAAGA